MISIHKKTDKQASLRTVLTSVAGLLLPATMMLCACSGSSVKGRDHDHEHEGQDAHNVVLEEEQMKAVDIKLGKIERRNLNSSVRVNGRTALAPQYRASVTSLVGGVIRSITVIEGNLVQKGQTVAYIENTDIVALQRDYLSNRSAMIAAEQEHNRQKELAKAGAGVQKDLQQATAACHIAKAQLLGVVSQLRQLGISEAAVNLGAKQKKRMFDTIKLAMIYATGMMIIGVIFFETIPQTLLGFFNASEAMIKIGTPALRIIAIHFIFAGFSIVCSATFQAVGKGTYSLLTSLIRQLLVLLPCAYVLSLTGNLDLIWLCFPIAEIFSAVTSFILMKRTRRHLEF